MSKYTYIIDNGHGGIVDGKYTTSPNYDPSNPKTWVKMWVHNGKPIYEGEFNRLVVQRLEKKLHEYGIDYRILVPEPEDVSLLDRVQRINNTCKSDPNKFILISVHANAGGGGEAYGDEIWTTKGVTNSDKFASLFSEGYRDVLSRRKFRKDTRDGDVDKESNFYILKKSVCPAFLTENGFFDNPKEAAFQMSEEGIEAFAEAHFRGIIKIENYSFQY